MNTNPTYYIKNLEEIEIDYLSGEVKILSSGEIFNILPFSKVQKDIMEKGSLLTI